MERKILVGVDQSYYCQNILNYLCELFARQPEVKFHLLSIVSYSGSQTAKDLLEQNDLLSTVDNHTRKRFVDCKAHLRNSRKKLLACGFFENQIEVSVKLSRLGIIKDIIHEAKTGLYYALVIGKKDLGLLARMISGSISGGLIKENAGLPFWIVSGKANSPKFIFPVDCSPHTLDAADHLAFIIKDNPNIEITLFHSCSLLAGEEISPKEQFYEKWGKDWCDEHLKGEDEGHFHFSAPEQILKDGGVSPERIHRLKSKAGIEPGQMIVHHVKYGGYGTIVMGRRHKDVSKGIFQGVSDRVLANVSDVAVWIIG